MKIFYNKCVQSAVRSKWPCGRRAGTTDRSAPSRQMRQLFVIARLGDALRRQGSPRVLLSSLCDYILTTILIFNDFSIIFYGSGWFIYGIPQWFCNKIYVFFKIWYAINLGSKMLRKKQKLRLFKLWKVNHS